MNELHHSLESMGVVQYLFAVAFLICYALTIGDFLGAGARVKLGLTGLLSAFGFAFTADVWVHGVLLIAFTVIGMGLFLGVAWALKTLFASAVGEVSVEAAYGDALSASFEETALPEPAAARLGADMPAAEPALGRFLATDRATLDQQAS